MEKNKKKNWGRGGRGPCLPLTSSASGFDVYAQFQIREREECQGVYLEEDNIPIFEAGRMKTKDKRQDV